MRVSPSAALEEGEVVCVCVGFWEGVVDTPAVCPSNSTERDLKRENGCDNRKLVGRSLATDELEVRNVSGTLVVLNLEGEMELETDAVLDVELDLV